MSNIDTMNSKSNLDCIADELLNELTPDAAEVIEGGGYLYDSDVSFYYGEEYLNGSNGSNIVTGSVGGKITLRTNLSSDKYSRAFFYATIYNTNTEASSTKKVYTGSGVKTTWTGVKGNSYKIYFTDNSSDKISGSASVSFS